MVSELRKSGAKSEKDLVLILVVVEDGLGALLKVDEDTTLDVLILVVVEDGLGEVLECQWTRVQSLNPCCSGRWSRSHVPWTSCCSS